MLNKPFSVDTGNKSIITLFNTWTLYLTNGYPTGLVLNNYFSFKLSYNNKPRIYVQS